MRISELFSVGLSEKNSRAAVIGEMLIAFAVIIALLLYACNIQ